MSLAVVAVFLIDNKEYTFPRPSSFSDITKGVRRISGVEVESISFLNEETGFERVISDQSQMKQFWKYYRCSSVSKSVQFTFLPKYVSERPQSKKKARRFTEKMRVALIGSDIEYINGSKFFCNRCRLKLTFDCPEKIMRHVESNKHKVGLPGLLLSFLDTFEFPEYKKSKRSHVSTSGYSTLYKTVKNKKQIRESFAEFVGVNTIERHAFSKITQRCGVRFSKTDSFFCLCPVCQVPGSRNKDSEGFKRHRILIKDRSLRFKKDLMDPESLVCVIDFSSNIRSKRVLATQDDGFVYNQWTLFNLTVLQTAESEVVERYFDVFTFHKYGKERVLRHNSEYVINALDLIFRDQLFDAHRGKRLSLWSDNGRTLKSSAIVVYLAKLSGTRFASVSQKFFVKFHGKSICDRHFGCIARARYHYSDDMQDTEDLRLALSNISSEVFLEIPDKPLNKKAYFLKIQGIAIVDVVEDIRLEGDNLTLNAKVLELKDNSVDVQETVTSRIISKFPTREKRKKKIPQRMKLFGN